MSSGYSSQPATALTTRWSVILQSPVQIALVLIPALVLLSGVIGGAELTLVLSPLLGIVLAITTLIAAFVVLDGGVDLARRSLSRRSLRGYRGIVLVGKRPIRQAVGRIARYAD